MPKKDLTGLVVGKLTVLKPTEKRASNGATIWLCQCECGNICEVVSSNLTRLKNPTSSCGCKTASKNLVNQKFGLLTVKSATNKRINGKIIWECECECGNIHYVNTGNLQSGAVRSCGCLKQSKKDNSIKKETKDFVGQTFNN